MTAEERSKWICRVLMLMIAAIVVCGVWFYRDRISGVKTQIPQVTRQKHLIEILHFHLPGQPESERLADHLNQVESRFFGEVLVTRVDVQSHPERAKAEQVTGTPEVVILRGASRAFRFQGLWPRDRIEQRVEEILRGIRRMEKGWMPPGINRRLSGNRP